MKVGIVCSLLCCLIAFVLAELCGLGNKVNQSVNPMASPPSLAGGASTASPEQSAAATQAYFSNFGPAKLFGGLFAKKEPGNWDEALQWAGQASSHGDYARAEDYLNVAMRMAESNNPNDIKVATTASYLANVDVKDRKFGEAERLYKRALAIDEKQLPANNPDVAEIRRDLADVLRREGNGQEAAKLVGKGVAGAPRKRTHPRTEALAKSRPRSTGKPTQSSSQVGFGVSSIFRN